MLQKKHWIVTSLCIVIMLGGLWVGYTQQDITNEPAVGDLQPDLVTDCVIREVELTVSGHSMTGLVEDGEQLKAQFGYYDCTSVKRDDWVLYRFGNQRSYVKVVRGLYPDHFAIEPSTTGQGWHIRVNNTVLTNSTGQPFVLEAHKGKQLRDEAKLYQGQIPRGKFLIMGNLLEGSHDSSWYGLINRDQLLAKIVNLPQ